MASEVVRFESASIKPVPYGLEVSNSISRDEWVQAYLACLNVEGVAQWYKGDLLSHAEYRWKGEMYKTMMGATGEDYGTLRNLSYVAGTYPQEIRAYIYEKVNESQIKKSSQDDFQTKLSFKHFRYVAPLVKKNPAAAWDLLIRAGSEGWTVERLMDELDSGGGEEPALIGNVSFRLIGRKLLKGYAPVHEDIEYDEKTWLTEMHEWTGAELRKRGIL